MRLLVTGGSGFLGRRFVTLAVGRGHSVIGLARSSSAAGVLESLGAETVRGDLNDPESIKTAFAGSNARALVNIASLGFGHGPSIVEAAEAAGLRRAVFVSTTGVTTRLNPASKAVRLAAEEAIKRSTLDWTIIRPTMIYGAPDDRNLSRLLTVARRSPVLPLPGGGRRLQQPVHVEDLAEALLAAVMTDRAIARTYDIAGPEPFTFRELINSAGRAVGRRAIAVPIPMSAAMIVVRGHERLSKRPRLRVEQLERLAEDKAFSIEDAVRDLGFAPRSFDDGIRSEAALL